MFEFIKRLLRTVAIVLLPTLATSQIQAQGMPSSAELTRDYYNFKFNPDSPDSATYYIHKTRGHMKLGSNAVLMQIFSFSNDKEANTRSAWILYAAASCAKKWISETWMAAIEFGFDGDVPQLFKDARTDIASPQMFTIEYKLATDLNTTEITDRALNKVLSYAPQICKVAQGEQRNIFVPMSFSNSESGKPEEKRRSVYSYMSGTTRANGSTISSWYRSSLIIEEPSIGSDGTPRKKIDGTPYTITKRLAEHSMYLVESRCDISTTRIVEFVQYDENGRTVESRRYDQSQMRAPIPNSLGEAFMDYTCQLHAK